MSYSLDEFSLRQRKIPFMENLSSTFARLTGRSLFGAGNKTPSEPKPSAEEEDTILDTASQPVVTLCGHFAHQWMKSGAAQCDTCPTCKSALSIDKIIPIYARGRESVDPRRNKDIPSRPSAQRTEPGSWWLPRSFWNSFRTPTIDSDFTFSISPFGFVFTTGGAGRNNARTTAREMLLFQELSNIFSLIGLFILFIILVY